MDKFNYANFTSDREVFTPELLELLHRLADDLWALRENRQFANFMMARQSLSVQNPAVQFTKDSKAGKYDGLSDDEYDKIYAHVVARSKLFHDEPSVSLKTNAVWKHMNTCGESLYRHIVRLLRFYQLTQLKPYSDDEDIAAEPIQEEEASWVDEYVAAELIEDDDECFECAAVPVYEPTEVPDNKEYDDCPAWEVLRPAWLDEPPASLDEPVHFTDEEYNDLADCDACIPCENLVDCANWADCANCDGCPGVISLEDSDDAASAVEVVNNTTNTKPYAGHRLSKDDLVDPASGAVNHTYNEIIQIAYHLSRYLMFQDTHLFFHSDNNLYSSDGKTLYIKELDRTLEYKISGSYEITDDFYRFLVSLDKWDFADGMFEKYMEVGMEMEQPVVSDSPVQTSPDSVPEVLDASQSGATVKRNSRERKVWITDGSKFYHHHKSAHKMGKARRVSKSEAEAMGKTPCHVCFPNGM